MLLPLDWLNTFPQRRSGAAGAFGRALLTSASSLLLDISAAAAASNSLAWVRTSLYARQLPGMMPAKSRFTRLDAFAKTVEDARIRTNSGGIITIASLLIVLWLVWGEWADYRRIVVEPELIVDKSRGALPNQTTMIDPCQADFG